MSLRKGLLTIKDEAILTHYMLKELGLSIDSIQEFLLVFARVKCSKASYMGDFIPLDAENFDDYLKSLPSSLDNNRVSCCDVEVSKSSSYIGKQVSLLTDACYLIKSSVSMSILSWENYKSYLAEVIKEDTLLNDVVTFLSLCRVKEVVTPLEYLEVSLQAFKSYQNRVCIPTIELSEDVFNSVKLDSSVKGDTTSELILIHKMILSLLICSNLPTVRLGDYYRFFAPFDSYNLESKMAQLINLPLSKFESTFLSLK